MSDMNPNVAAPRRASATEMPILDLGDWLAGGPIASLAAQFKAACTNTGFLYVRNHGIPRGVVDGVFDASWKLQPDEHWRITRMHTAPL